MNVADFRNAVKAAVVAVVPAGTSPKAVAWSDEQRPTAQPVIILDVVSDVVLHDRETETPALGGGTAVWTLSSLHHMNVQVRAESIHGAPGRDALFVLEQIRAGLRRPSVLATASGAGVELVAPEIVMPITKRSFLGSDQRTVSSYSFETQARAVLDFAPTESGYEVTSVDLEGEAELVDQTVVELDQTVAKP